MLTLFIAVAMGCLRGSPLTRISTDDLQAAACIVTEAGGAVFGSKAHMSKWDGKPSREFMGGLGALVSCHRG